MSGEIGLTIWDNYSYNTLQTTPKLQKKLVVMLMMVMMVMMVIMVMMVMMVVTVMMVMIVMAIMMVMMAAQGWPQVTCLRHLPNPGAKHLPAMVQQFKSICLPWCNNARVNTLI